MPPTTGNDVVLSTPFIDISPLVNWFLDFFSSGFPVFVSGLKNAIGILIGISIPVIVLFIIGIVYSVEMLKRIRAKEAKMYDLKVEPAYEVVPETGDPSLSNRWQKVGVLIESQNENDWKQAIIEADIILDDALTKLGYKGESVGEKLKRAEPADFHTLNDAWEAHKVRNDIAHNGSNMHLNQHEAKRVFNLYRRVFEEFYYL